MWRTTYDFVLALARLIRLPNALAIALLYLAASRYAATGSLQFIIISASAWFLAASASYLFNDLVDVHVDAINCPSRPLLHGDISRRAAICAGLVIIMTVLLLCLALRPDVSLCPLLGLSGGLFYSSFVRYRSAAAANILTATLIAVVPLSASPERRWPLVFIAVFLFAVTLARELKKDILDYEGDKQFRPEPVLRRYPRFGKLLFAFLIVAGLSATVMECGLSRSFSFCVSGMPLLLIIFNSAGRNNASLDSRLLKLAAYSSVPALFLAM